MDISMLLDCIREMKEQNFDIGEVLDLDAYTGGFNLQIAWSTGYLAGTSAAV
jgi:predicted flavoprotein YhiN